jgi:hypothetical protein
LRPAQPGDVEFLTRVHAARGAGTADTRRVQTFVRDSEIWWRLHGCGALAHAFALPHVRSVWAATTPTHAASIRVMQKLGMLCRRRTLLEGIDSVIYSIDRGEFERRDRSFTTR